MEDRWIEPDEKVEKHGVFEDRTVWAKLRVNQRGQMGWRVWTWTDEGRPGEGEYFIAHGEIREALVDSRCGAFIVEMDERKRNILLSAIKKWEVEELQNPRT